ncbi:uncharacterized protein LOC123274710 [Cotesia glomerata]|uniref:uncharacterized protein LOC123274710 n=1 Tax=Cotesia glomerata TaxID=32391 RepID=UPI001D0221E7|nr:uncharacterized protein LOC123274710 [Cotesia glomerata]
MKTNLKRIVCDYDNDFIRATRDYFEDIDVRGSWYHFINLWTRKWRSLGLATDVVHSILQITWCLPLFPVEKFPEMINMMKYYARADEDNSATLNTFVTSIELWCLPLAKMISLFDCKSDNDINLTEDFVRKIGNHLGVEPKLHRYLGNIARVLENSTKEFKSKRNAEIERKAFQIKINASIRSLQYTLKKEKITSDEFVTKILNDMSFFYEVHHQLSYHQYNGDQLRLQYVPDIQFFTNNSSLAENINENDSENDDNEERQRFESENESTIETDELSTD